MARRWRQYLNSRDLPTERAHERQQRGRRLAHGSEVKPGALSLRGRARSLRLATLGRCGRRQGQSAFLSLTGPDSRDSLRHLRGNGFLAACVAGQTPAPDLQRHGAAIEGQARILKPRLQFIRCHASSPSQGGRQCTDRAPSPVHFTGIVQRVHCAGLALAFVARGRRNLSPDWLSLAYGSPPARFPGLCTITPRQLVRCTVSPRGSGEGRDARLNLARLSAPRALPTRGRRASPVMFNR